MKKIIIYIRDIENKFYSNTVNVQINKNNLKIKYKTLKVEYSLPNYVNFKDWYNKSFDNLNDYYRFLEFINDKIEETKKTYNEIISY